MDVAKILKQIDVEIAQLKSIRDLLVRGMGKTGKSATGKVNRQAAKPKKRNLTPEGRRRIAEAVRRRWAAQKKAVKS